MSSLRLNSFIRYDDNRCADCHIWKQLIDGFVFEGDGAEGPVLAPASATLKSDTSPNPQRLARTFLEQAKSAIVLGVGVVDHEGLVVLRLPAAQLLGNMLCAFRCRSVPLKPLPDQRV